MQFRMSFCDPFSPEIVDLGFADESSVKEKFSSIDWTGYLSRMKQVDEQEINYSPSLEVENPETKQALSLSIAGEPEKNEWYIFYKRPKEVKALFGLLKTKKESYLTDITGQTLEDACACLDALLRSDTHFLENKIK